ncbi:MAG: phosphoglycerate dehydrogenase [Chloroflexi bacterium]|nr:phosphoglycerate dehydrogenase [Chloroflexota bacterium]
MTQPQANTVLVCAPIDEEARQFLAAHATMREANPQTKADLMAALDTQVAGLVMGVRPFVDGETMDCAPGLKVIGRKGVGYDNIDVQAAHQRGIVVVNTPTAPLEPVAEMTLGLMIALARSFAGGDRITRAGRWDDRRTLIGPELRGKTLGIVGFGRIGQRVAELVQPLGMRLLYYDVLPQMSCAERFGAQRVELPTLFRQADFITVHVPLTEGTHHLIGQDLLALMKPTAYFINIARGPVVDEQALFQALQAKRIAGAALDVLEQEPPAADNPLFTLENVLLTPHMGGLSKEGNQAMCMVVRDIVAVLEGRAPEFPVQCAGA